MHYSFRPALALALLVLLAALFLAPVPAPAQGDRPQRMFLPAVVNGPPVPNILGIEMSQLTTERGLLLMKASGTRWVRRASLQWKLVEPVEGGGYQWDVAAIKEVERDMITASELGLDLILPITGSPRWATAPYEADCAPVNPAKHAAFVRFVAELVKRYSGPPYNVRYWEIGNEPDAPVFASDSVFGCWGQERDPYFGGRAYGELLNQVYPAIKAVNPNVKVLNGGLLLDQPYDPANPKSLIGRFFEGMLVAGAGNSFDMLSFHAYAFWRTPGLPPMGARDDWRVAYLKELMARYKVPEKPLVRTEAALLCPGEPTPECRWAQADFLSRLFVRSLRDKLAGNLWYVYDNDSYHNTALIEPGDVLVPRPAYFAYRQASTLLAGATYVGPLAGVPDDVEGYVLRRDGTTIIALWSDNPRPIAVPLPVAGTLRCISRDGGPISCPVESAAATLELQTGASYLVIEP